MVQLLRCLVLAQRTPKLYHKEAKQRFIVSIAVPRFEYPRFQMGARTALWSLIC